MNRRNFVTGSIASAVAVSSAKLALGAQGVGTPTGPVPGPVLIDAHVHVWKDDPAFPFAAGAHPSPRNATAEMLLSLMKANGVARTVLIQVIHYKWDNRYLADVLRRYPGTFMGVCRVNPQDPGAPDELSRLTEQGFRGVRISPGGGASGDWIGGPLMPPLWRRCAQLKVPMTVLAPVTRMPELMPLIEANPELTVVIDHMADSPLGEPKELEMLLALARYPHVFVKISHMWSLSKEPYPYPDAMAQVKRLIAGFGTGRLMWATDWPIVMDMLPYAKRVELYRDHMGFLSRQEHEDISYKTVEKVWNFGL